MANNALIYETLNNISTPGTMSVSTGPDGLMHLEGVFGVCGIRNRNQRVYEYNNYKKCIDELQMIIERDGGVAGEMEHPTDLNTHIDNISHKVERISIDENGVVRGRIALLDTVAGKNAQALVRGGLPLFISSRGFGEEDSQGNVKLEGIVTYDLVGTPGFEQAKLTLTEAKKSLCESYNPTKKYDSKFCIVPMNENSGDAVNGGENYAQDIKGMIEAEVAAAIAKAGTGEAITPALLEEYVSDVVKGYIDECISELAQNIDENMVELQDQIEKMKEKITSSVKKSVPSVTRHRIYLHKQ